MPYRFRDLVTHSNALSSQIFAFFNGDQKKCKIIFACIVSLHFSCFKKYCSSIASLCISDINSGNFHAALFGLSNRTSITIQKMHYRLLLLRLSDSIQLDTSFSNSSVEVACIHVLTKIQARTMFLIAHFDAIWSLILLHHITILSSLAMFLLLYQPLFFVCTMCLALFGFCFCFSAHFLFRLQITNCCGVCSPSTISADSYGTQNAKAIIICAVNGRQNFRHLHCRRRFLFVCNFVGSSLIRSFVYIFLLHSFSFPVKLFFWFLCLLFI